MAANHLRIHGLTQPISLSEYAKTKGVPEADILALIRELKIPAAFFEGQWYLEAAPNSPELRRQPSATNTQTSKLNDEKQRDLDAQRLREQFLKAHWSYDRLTPAQQQALLVTTKYAERPQPISYGLSRHDICVHCGRYPLNDGLMYRDEKSPEWRRVLFVWFCAYICACFGVFYEHASGRLASSPQIWTLLIVAAPACFILSCMLFATAEAPLNAYRRKRSRSEYVKYQKALELHELYQTTSQAAVHEAEQALLRRKHSYWAYLDGYEFEHATAEVLRQHQFNPRVTPGSADGGVDIEVTRGGLKGVVQCKAQVACVGPHVIRDLYGVIHHSKASFGIIVSRGGFTKGAVEFARDKPILFLDVSDLIAMQEGKDVLAEAFVSAQS